MAAEPLPLPIDDKPGLQLAPEYPPGVPVPDPPIIVIGREAHQTWDRVWGFIKHQTKPKIDAMQSLVVRSIQDAVPAIENYVGEELKVLGGYINDIGDFAAISQYVLNNELGQVSEWAYRNLNNLDASLYATLVHVNNIEGAFLPQINEDIARVREAIGNMPSFLIPQLQAWSVGNIFDPLVDDIGRTDAKIRGDVFGLMAATTSELQGQINGNHAEVLGLLGPLTAALPAIEKWINDCGDPMCQAMGPNTDLGKFLKALQLAGILSLLMEIANMSEADVEARLRELAGDVQHIVGAFESTFVGGGGTLKDFALSLI